ncbi:hypothetical protein SAMN06309944_0210 [Micrococcales bacterium KH10]|nr:hypothetical protein SAMN06309944_0210 [Micrococcales bacterium KH10]
MSNKTVTPANIEAVIVNIKSDAATDKRQTHAGSVGAAMYSGGRVDGAISALITLGLIDVDEVAKLRAELNA